MPKGRTWRRETVTPAELRDTLELSGPWTYNGEKLTFTIRLVRVK
jgi:hypothetical protein